MITAKKVGKRLPMRAQRRVEKLLHDTSNLSSFEAGRRAEPAFKACRDRLEAGNPLTPQKINKAGTGDLSWAGVNANAVGSVNDTVRTLLLPVPSRRALRSAGLSHRRNHGSTWAPKTQGRACLIARILSLVILNSISIAKGSSGPGSYSPAKWSWITSR